MRMLALEGILSGKNDFSSAGADARDHVVRVL